MRAEPNNGSSIAHDRWEIFNGDVDAFRKRWGMGEIDLEDADKRRLTAREYVTDILGIGYDG